MRYVEFKGHQLYIPDSGGKAGKGLAKTGTVQVRHDNQIVKQFRFTWDSQASRDLAHEKAFDFINSQTK